MNELLKLDKLDIGYDKKIVNNISLSIGEKELICILSPNNCGKTTFIKTLGGIVKAKDGKIIYNGKELNRNSFKKYIKQIGVVFENINDTYICDQVDDELKFPLIHLAYPYKKIKKRVDEVAHLLDFENKLDKKISEISMLDKAKLSIGVALMHDPDIILVDDIFKSLKPKDKDIVMDIFKLLIVTYNKTVIFTTSDLNDCKGLDKIVVFGDKKVLMKGSFNEIIKKDNDLSKVGIDIPIMIDLSRKLQFYDLIDDVYYDVDKVVDALWK